MNSENIKHADDVCDIIKYLLELYSEFKSDTTTERSAERSAERSVVDIKLQEEDMTIRFIYEIINDVLLCQAIVFYEGIRILVLYIGKVNNNIPFNNNIRCYSNNDTEIAFDSTDEFVQLNGKMINIKSTKSYLDCMLFNLSTINFSDQELAALEFLWNLHQFDYQQVYYRLMNYERNKILYSTINNTLREYKNENIEGIITQYS